jgi:hypothetical protein
MGHKHREEVWWMPTGLVAFDEKSVLLVLADETYDVRLEWGHNYDVLRQKLNGVSETWLKRRLRALAVAGFIIRRRQYRRPDGTWERPIIGLQPIVEAAAGRAPWPSPTPRGKAEAERRREDRFQGGVSGGPQ